MNRAKLSLPIPIILMLALLASTFLVDQLSSIRDVHWQIAELSFDDPVYVGLSMFWFACISWLSIDIIRKRKHIPSTLKILVIIIGVFFIIDFFENEMDLSLLFSFQFLEFLLWMIVYVLSQGSYYRKWFIE